MGSGGMSGRHETSTLTDFGASSIYVLRIGQKSFRVDGLNNPRFIILCILTQQEMHFEIKPKTQQTLSQRIIQNALAPTDFLSLSPRSEGQPISYHYYTTLVNR